MRAAHRARRSRRVLRRAGRRAGARADRGPGGRRLSQAPGAGRRDPCGRAARRQRRGRRLRPRQRAARAGSSCGCAASATRLLAEVARPGARPRADRHASRSSRCRCSSTASPSRPRPARSPSTGRTWCAGAATWPARSTAGKGSSCAGPGTARPRLRCAAAGPDEVLVLVDGFPINDPLTGRADLSRISSREVAAVTLVPGAQTVRAGSRAVAGVILVETRRDVRPEGVGVGRQPRGARAPRLGGSAGAADRERRRASAWPNDFPYTVPEVRGGGEGDALQCRRRAVRRRAHASTGRSRSWCAESLAIAACPAPRPIRRSRARAQDRSVLLGARHDGAAGGDRARSSGSRRAPRIRRRRPARPTTATPTASAARRSSRCRVPGRRRRAGAAPPTSPPRAAETASPATASATAPRSRRPRFGPTPG